MPSLKLGLLLALSSLQVQACRLREISPVGHAECQRCGVERVSSQDYIVGEKSVEAQVFIKTVESGDQCYDSGGQVSLDVESSDWIQSPVWSQSDRQQGNCPRKPKERDRREQSSARFTEDGPQYALTSGHCVFDQKTKTLTALDAIQEKY